MTVPNAGDFIVRGNRSTASIICPICLNTVWDDLLYDSVRIRNLIGAASEHARTHTRTEINA